MSSPKQVVVSGGFDDLKSRDLRFLEEAARLGDVTVLLWPDNLIEHVTEPLEFFRATRRRLRPGGVVYIETPNAGSIVYRVGGILCNLTGARPRKLFERLFPPQHIQYFTPGSLAGLAGTAGFEIVRIGTRVLPGPDIAASALVRLAMASLQVLDRCTSRCILIWAVLRRNT